MKTSEIERNGIYRASGGAKVEVLEAGVPSARWSNRKDGVRIKYLDGPRAGATHVLPTRDIAREWTDEDDAKLERERARENAQANLNDRLGELGFLTAVATISERAGQRSIALRFKDDEAERVLALLEKEANDG